MKIEVSYSMHGPSTGLPWELRFNGRSELVKEIIFDGAKGHGVFDAHTDKRRKGWLEFDAEIEILDGVARLYAVKP
jgi:hypothetical protein